MLRFALPAVVAFGFLAAPAWAADPKAPAVNLADLKAAVAAADKRGENVGMIREALAAFEKALAKPALKAGEAPPELTALREAVEATLKKGENVEAVSKELGLIEKALTGRAFERPKLEPKQPEPEPVYPPQRGKFGGGRVVIGGGNRIVIDNNGGFNATSITISRNTFTIKARDGDVHYTVTGSTKKGDAPTITIKDGEKMTIETDDIKKVPEAHRPAVERLLGSVKRG